ncbi:MAG: VanZ family protein [Pseudomonadota bacterium]|nr:VanZ family protein [Pseudomonadota bacterium]
MSDRPHATQLPQYFAALYAVMIVYASLEPFSGWMAPLPGAPFFLFAPWPTRYTRYDIAINVAAYVPFGFFVALIGRRTPATTRLAAATVSAALLSAAMETTQMFLPSRDASTIDLVSNAAGGALGGIVATALNGAPGMRARIGEWRQRVFLGGRSGDLGIALLGIWLLAQVNPGIPLFAATFDPSLELARDLAGAMLQAAESAFNVVGVGLFLALLLNQRRYLGGAVLVLIGGALMLKGAAATVLLRSTMWDNWLKPGVTIGVAAGAVVLLLTTRMPRPVQTTLCGIALLSSLTAPLLAPDMWQARAPLALFDWPYGHLLNFNGLTHAVLVVWPVLASCYLMWLAGRPAWGETILPGQHGPS